jgi:hypothetical protein
MLGTICYMFRQCGAILGEFINNKGRKSHTYLGAGRPYERVLSSVKISVCTATNNIISVVFKLHLQEIKYCLL